MEFWLKKDNDDKLLFPVNPESFQISVKHNNTVLNISKRGDINLLGMSGLNEGVISSFFPAQNYNFVNTANGYKNNPYDYINQLIRWKDSHSILRLLIGSKINIQVVIESLKYGEEDGTGDVYFDLSLKEYVEITVEKVTSAFKKKYKKKSSRSKKSTKQTKYKVKKGDTLYKIAKKFYGKGKKWKKIYKANKKKIPNPNKLKKGIVLKIPK